MNFREVDEYDEIFEFKYIGEMHDFMGRCQDQIEKWGKVKVILHVKEIY